MVQQLQELNPGVDQFKVTSPVYYRQQGTEVLTSLRAYAAGLPLVYKGPTGSGKSTLAEHICYLLGVGFDALTEKYGKELERRVNNAQETPLSKIERKREAFRDGGFPLVTIVGHEDLDADTLKGRPYIVGDEAFWLNGNARLAARYGGIFYFDEPAEARPDSLVVSHSLSDHRKELLVEGLGEIVKAHLSFGFIMTYNDRYQDPRKRFKPSTSQRFVHLPIGYPAPEVELEIVTTQTGIDQETATKLIRIAGGTRELADKKQIKEGASPREVILAANLIVNGESPSLAAKYCLAYPLTDDLPVLNAIADLIKNQFKG